MNAVAGLAALAEDLRAASTVTREATKHMAMLHWLWIISGILACLACVGLSIAAFAEGKNGQGTALLLFTPVAFFVGIAAAFVLVIVALGWLVVAALSQ